MLPTKHYDLGLKAMVKFRPFTADEEIIRNILIDRKEYGLFVNCNPRVVFDIGAQIGCTSILFANAYPQALIFAFEPEPDNFELLSENAKEYPNIKVFNFALGAETCERTLFESDDEMNHGGFSFHDKGVNKEKSQTVKVVDVREAMRANGVTKIDLLKIDTEGCEKEILWRLYGHAMPDFIMGEAHGNRDFKMFDFLEETHDLQIHKEIGQRCFPFYALRRKDGGT